MTALQPVAFDAGHLIHPAGTTLTHAYFPVTGAMALTVYTRDGDGCETTTVGCEGVVGLPLYCGLTETPDAIVQQTKGRAYCLRAAAFQDAIRRSPALQTLMGRYAACSLRFAHQTAACNSLHTLRQRACRCLLTVQDRSGSEPIELPQSRLAEMLGVRRQSVSEVAAELRREGLIEYRRSALTIVDRAKLLGAVCCECYAAMRADYDRMVGALLGNGGSTPALAGA